MCAHDKIEARVKTIRTDEPPIRFRIEVTVNCTKCAEPFRFGKSWVSDPEGIELTANVAPGVLKTVREVVVPAEN